MDLGPAWALAPELAAGAPEADRCSHDARQEQSQHRAPHAPHRASPRRVVPTTSPPPRPSGLIVTIVDQSAWACEWS